MVSPAPDCLIAVDAMGADLGPAEVVGAVADALAHVPILGGILLFGQGDVLRPLLSTTGLDRNSRLTLVPCADVIGMHEKPIAALKQKKDASMVRAIEAVKEGRAHAVLSCGNTGALMAGGTLRLRPLPGVERPALATIIPTRHGRFVLVDAGANPDATDLHLVHNALLGAGYLRAAFGVPRPRVGLLTIGTEEGKGNPLVNRAHALFRKLPADLIDYTGLIEGFQVWDNRVDVVVCDGFTGNVLLKTWESLFHSLKEYTKDEIKKNPVRMLGFLLAQGAFKAMRNRLTPDQTGGAPLLGLRGPVFKAHGSSNRLAIRNAIRIACEAVTHNVAASAAADIERANQILFPAPAPATATAAGETA